MRRLTAVVIFSVAALALAACGDDGGSTSLGDIPDDVQDEVDKQLDDAQERAEDLGEEADDLADDVLEGDGEACSLLTVSEIESEVGNPVEEGIDQLSNICTWGSGAEETNVSVAIVDLPDPSACEDVWSADSNYDELDGFDGAAFTSANAVASIPQADVIVCGDPTQLSVTVTGGYGDPESDTAALSDQAEALAHLAVDRL
jgi:hypothetical protein